MPSPRLLVLAAGAFAIGVDGFVIAPILPELAARLDVPLAAAGQLVTVFTLVYALAAPVLATATARWDRRVVLAGTLVVFSAGNALSAIAADYPLMMASRVVAALGAALFLPTASATAVTLSPPDRMGRALALVMGGLSAAGLVGVPVGTLLAQAVGASGVFWLVTGVGLAAAAGVAVLLPPVRIPATLTLRERLALAARPRLAALLATTALAMAGAFTTITYIAPLLAEAADVTGRGLTVVMAVSGLASVVGVAVAGRAVDARGGRAVLAAALTALTAGALLLPVAGAAVPAAALVFVLGVAGATVAPAQQHRLMRAAPEAGTLLLSLNSSAIYLGMSAGGALGGLVVAGAGASALGAASAVLYVTALLATALVRTDAPVPGAERGQEPSRPLSVR
ncbi:MFS transporter [Actinomadura namibiensis]|uniref:Putative MFS family arabinose efflux permease n=1 Tax=Actinomadura namibiensis TaxID=182080 RepID=A0A7W3LYU8_ACTNM|nr:MFS transporter [Actinomadura namibiensis]MBA8956715.1 putative MFS family arabinose efflux permease [Actinomadura namibiensis]